MENVRYLYDTMNAAYEQFLAHKEAYQTRCNQIAADTARFKVGDYIESSLFRRKILVESITGELSKDLGQFKFSIIYRGKQVTSDKKLDRRCGSSRERIIEGSHVKLID